MKITLKIEGMTCHSCEELIKDAVNDLPGINSITVSQKKGSAEINFNEAKVSKMQIIEIIKEEGYKVCK
jgi:copper chaperone CopZ